MNHPPSFQSSVLGAGWTREENMGALILAYSAGPTRTGRD